MCFDCIARSKTSACQTEFIIGISQRRDNHFIDFTDTYDFSSCFYQKSAQYAYLSGIGTYWFLRRLATNDYGYRSWEYWQ